LRSVTNRVFFSFHRSPTVTLVSSSLVVARRICSSPRT
jgi:hypothetical protein